MASHEDPQLQNSPPAQPYPHAFAHTQSQGSISHPPTPFYTSTPHQIETPPLPPPKPPRHSPSPVPSDGRNQYPNSPSVAPSPFPLPFSTGQYAAAQGSGGWAGPGIEQAYRQEGDVMGGAGANPDGDEGAQKQWQFPPLADGWVPDMLLDMGKPDLQDLLQNRTLLTALLHSPQTAPPPLQTPPHPPETPLTRLSQLLAHNQTLAAHASSLAAHLATQRQKTQAHLLRVRGLETQHRHKQRAVEAAVAPWAPRALYQGLVAGIGEAEGRARAVEERFLDSRGGVASEAEVSEWVRRVREERGLVALRRERRARWDEGRVGGWR